MRSGQVDGRFWPESSFFYILTPVLASALKMFVSISILKFTLDFNLKSYLNSRELMRSKNW